MTPRREPPEVDRQAAGRAAVAARRARSAIKQAIRARERTAGEVFQVGISDGDSAEAGLRVGEVLTSIPGFGPVRLERALTELDISPKKRLGGLGAVQRGRLLHYLQTSQVQRGPTVPRSGRLVVLAGPTAVGKGTVSSYIRERVPDVQLSVSATTRSPRPGEVDGKHYYFVTDREFDRMIDGDELLEWAVVHNSYRYGTPRPPVDAALAAGKRVLLEIDLQGARAVRRVMPEAVLVFLLPPSWEELVRRLIGRGTEDIAEQQRRLETAKIELAAQDEFDYRVVNNDVHQAAMEVVELMTA
ncbi:MAG: guanylate kinase [Salinibacterium sp.]|nr:guanylate kinase [Salinibacterium sp.]